MRDKMLLKAIELPLHVQTRHQLSIKYPRPPWPVITYTCCMIIAKYIC